MHKRDKKHHGCQWHCEFLMQIPNYTWLLYQQIRDSTRRHQWQYNLQTNVYVDFVEVAILCSIDGFSAGGLLNCGVGTK